jgi:hypothetical protein
MDVAYLPELCAYMQGMDRTRPSREIVEGERSGQDKLRRMRPI